MHLHFTALRPHSPSALLAAVSVVTSLVVGGSMVGAESRSSGLRANFEVPINTDESSTPSGVERVVGDVTVIVNLRTPRIDSLVKGNIPRAHTNETDEHIMRYTDENGNNGTLWCNPGPCTAGSPLKHGWATGVGTFLPLELVEDVKKTLGEAVNKEIATFSSATNRKIFNITKDALLASAETSDDPKLKSAAAMTKKQIKSTQVAFEKSQEDKSGSSIVVETPVEEAPVVEAPVVEAPVVETPVEEAPVVEAPVVEAPVVEAPVVEAPVEEWDDDCAGMEQCNIPIEG